MPQIVSTMENVSSKFSVPIAIKIDRQLCIAPDSIRLDSFRLDSCRLASGKCNTYETQRSIVGTANASNNTCVKVIIT